MSDFWVEADAKGRGKVAGLSDDEVMDTLRGKADEAREAGHKNSEAGIRKAMEASPDEARSYLAMMRVVGGATKRISREAAKAKPL